MVNINMVMRGSIYKVRASWI